MGDKLECQTMWKINKRRWNACWVHTDTLCCGRGQQGALAFPERNVHGGAGVGGELYRIGPAPLGGEWWWRQSWSREIIENTVPQSQEQCLTRSWLSAKCCAPWCTHLTGICTAHLQGRVDLSEEAETGRGRVVCPGSVSEQHWWGSDLKVNDVVNAF